MAGPLTGKAALVTGAASGMGAVMARALLAAGARVTGMDIDAGGLAARALELGAGYAAIAGDISSLDDCRRAVAEARPDILVNNAGVGIAVAAPPGHRGPVRLWEADPAGWLRMLSVNAAGAFLMARFAVGGMMERRWGRIINVTTSFDTMLNPGLAAYGAAKAALEASTAVWARELAGSGVTVNILVPGGPTDTNLLPPAARAAPGVLKPGIMAEPVAWLASPAADAITGRRFVARDWASAAAREGSPAAWPDLAAQAAAERPA